MDLRKLKTLIDLVSDSNVSELEITEAEGKVRIVKGSNVVMQGYAPAQMQMAPMAHAPAAVVAPAAPAEAAAPEAPALHAVKSPMVGTFYRSASPGANPTRRLGDVAEGLALAAGMTELVLEYLGEPDEFPNLAPLTETTRGLRVTIQQADFTKGPSASASFASAAVTELAFKWCDLALLPPVTGFPNLKKLDVEECTFYDEGGAVLRTLAPVPTLEHVRLEGCEGLDDASPIAALPSLKTLVLCHFRVEYPDFDDAAGAALKAKLLSGAVNADGTGRMCKVVTRRLDICRAELEAARLARCDSECCGPCECGECSDCE
jgi:acetyl-CoA carboxylase biotin carboxyl carrier protein